MRAAGAAWRVGLADEFGVVEQVGDAAVAGDQLVCGFAVQHVVPAQMHMNNTPMHRAAAPVIEEFPKLNMQCLVGLAKIVGLVHMWCRRQTLRGYVAHILGLLAVDGLQVLHALFDTRDPYLLIIQLHASIQHTDMSLRAAAPAVGSAGPGISPSTTCRSWFAAWPPALQTTRRGGGRGTSWTRARASSFLPGAA